MRLLISGGGTGGHIYPALALIEALKKREPDAEVLYVGTNRGLESKIVPDANIPFATIQIQGFKRSLSLENFKTIYLFLKGVQDSKKIIRDLKPDVVVGTGGYVCGSVVYAASKLGIPTLIHEQNSVSGVTNKFLSRYVDKIGICFADVKKDFPTEKVVFTGNPRAQQVVGIQPNQMLEKYGLRSTRPTLLVFGGSRGAEKINQTALAAAQMFKDSKYQILFVTGRVHYDKLMQRPEAQNVPSNFVIQPYIPNMPLILPDIDAILGRAGATSLAEITAIGIPSILVPSPYVTNDHQTKNALSLVDQRAAKLLKEEELTPEAFYKEVNELMTDDNLRVWMAENAKRAGVPDAADKLLEVLDSISK